MVLVGVGFGLLVPTLAAKAMTHGKDGPGRVVLGLVSFAAAMALGAPAFLAWRRCGVRAWAAAQAVVYAVAVAAFFDFANAPADNLRSAKPAARAAAALLKQPGTTLYTPVAEEASVYLPLGVRYEPAASRVVFLIDDRTNTAREDAAWFETRLARRIVDPPRRVATRGNMPDPRWKLFEVTLEPGKATGMARRETPHRRDLRSAVILKSDSDEGSPAD